MRHEHSTIGYLGIMETPNAPSGRLRMVGLGRAVAGQPGTSNCDGCSLAYTADADLMAVTIYEAFMNFGNGAESSRILCTAY